MKLHLNSFICEFDEASENVALFCTDNLQKFLSEHNLTISDFKPDFVNEQLNSFIFCTDNAEWKQFVKVFYSASETTIVLNVIPTPDDFNIYEYFSCNIFTIEYIVNPEYRNRAFLNQVSHNNSSKYFINKLYDALDNPKKSKIGRAHV